MVGSNNNNMDLMGIITSPYKGCHLGDTLKSTMTPISRINQQQQLINKRQSQGEHSFSTIKYVERFIRSYVTVILFDGLQSEYYVSLLIFFFSSVACCIYYYVGKKII